LEGKSPKSPKFIHTEELCAILLLLFLYTNLFTVIGRTMVQAVGRRPLVTGQWFVPAKPVQFLRWTE